MKHKPMPLPECPVCHATGGQCKRPSGHAAMLWHLEREDAFARECGCAEICQPWLETIGAQMRAKTVKSRHVKTGEERNETVRK